MSEIQSFYRGHRPALDQRAHSRYPRHAQGLRLLQTRAKEDFRRPRFRVHHLLRQRASDSGDVYTPTVNKRAHAHTLRARGLLTGRDALRGWCDTDPSELVDARLHSMTSTSACSCPRRRASGRVGGAALCLWTTLTPCTHHSRNRACTLLLHKRPLGANGASARPDLLFSLARFLRHSHTKLTLLDDIDNCRRCPHNYI